MASRTNDFVPPLNQIAFSVVDLRLTERWFREGFGLLPAGGSRALMRGPLAANVQGLTRAASTCWWLLGRNSWFQLELFQFERPMAKLMPADFRPCDIGYTRIGIWVEDFDATMKRLAGLGSQPLTAPQGERGSGAPASATPTGSMSKSWRTTRCRNPTRRGRVDCPAAIRSVTLSVPQLVDAAAFFEDGHRPQGQHRGPSHARARGVVGPGGCHHGEQAVRRRRGADRGGAVPRSRWKAAAR